MECLNKNEVSSGHLRILWLAMFALVSNLLLTGCGSREYDERYEATLKVAENAQPFLRLWKDAERTELTGGGLEGDILSVRLPTLFNKTKDSAAFDYASREPRDETLALDPYRVQPYFNEFDRSQAHVGTYETIVTITAPSKEKNGIGRSFRWPIYCIIAVEAESPGSGQSGTPPVDKEGKAEKKPASSPSPAEDYGDTRRQEIFQLLTEKFGAVRTVRGKSKAIDRTPQQIGVDAEWQSTDPLPTPDGGRATWHRLRAAGDQFFHSYEDAEEPNTAKPLRYRGEYLVFHRKFDSYDDTPGGEEGSKPATPRHVFIAFRSPLDVASRERVGELANAVLGTVKLLPPPADGLEGDESEAGESEAVTDETSVQGAADDEAS